MIEFRIEVRPWKGWLRVVTIDVSDGVEIDSTIVKADQTEYQFIAAAIARAMQRHGEDEQ